MEVVRLISRTAFTKADVLRDVGGLPLAVSVDIVNLREPAAELLLTNSSVTMLFDEASGVTTPTPVAAVARSTVAVISTFAAIITPVPAIPVVKTTIAARDVRRAWCVIIMTSPLRSPRPMLTSIAIPLVQDLFNRGVITPSVAAVEALVGVESSNVTVRTVR